jgi:hyaluronan synthase
VTRADTTQEPIRVAGPLLPAGLFVVLIAAALAVIPTRLSLYGAALAAFLAVKMVLCLLPERRTGRRGPPLNAAVIVTLYNEDPATVRGCLASIAAQDVEVGRVIVVDDGSTAGCRGPALRNLVARYGFGLIEQPSNAGKREALAAGFLAAPEADVFVCVDSDTLLAPDAVRLGLRRMRDPGVVAATGVVVAQNYTSGPLAALIDVRYVSAFLGERAAYSRLGSVLCVSGVLAFWRADVVRQGLPGFRAQEFLGRRMTTGDDRHLTNLCLRHGRVVVARDAVAATVVPTRVGHYLRQQARWGRSFWRESWWALTHLTPSRVPWWLTLAEVTTTVAFSGAVMVAVALAAQGEVGSYAAWVCLAAWARSVHVFAVRRRRWWWPLVGFAVAPLYAVLNLAVMLPLRVWSMVTVGRTGWGTRAEVEPGARLGRLAAGTLP